MATTFGTKRRRAITTQSESPAIPATPTRRPGDPRLSNPIDYPLVCERSSREFTGTTEPIVYRPKSEHEVRLMARGFHPTCWLPLAAAAEWRSFWYPLHDSAESIGQWRALIEGVADMLWKSGADGLKRGDDMRAERDHDAALIEGTESDEASATFDRHELEILGLLHDSHPALKLGVEIADAVQCSQRTIVDRLKSLTTAGLVCKPHGPRSGSTLTEKGIEVAKANCSKIAS